MNSIQIQAPSGESTLALSVEGFVKKAETWLQNHYQEGSTSADIQQILQAIANLQLDVDIQALGREFDLHCERKDLEADYYDSAWY